LHEFADFRAPIAWCMDFGTTSSLCRPQAGPDHRKSQAFAFDVDSVALVQFLAREHWSEIEVPIADTVDRRLDEGGSARLFEVHPRRFETTAAGTSNRNARTGRFTWRVEIPSRAAASASLFWPDPRF